MVVKAPLIFFFKDPKRLNGVSYILMIYVTLKTQCFSSSFLSPYHTPLRDNIIQPMGVTTDGKLAPLCDQMRHGTVDVEEEEEEEGEDSEADQ